MTVTGKQDLKFSWEWQFRGFFYTFEIKEGHSKITGKNKAGIVLQGS